MFCKHFIKILMFAPLIFFWGASRGKAVRSGGVHSIFLIKNMKSATAFCPDRLCFGDSASCYLSLWNTVAVHIFYSEHTVYEFGETMGSVSTRNYAINFPDPLCCARSMAELFFLIQKLSLWESFWSYIFIYGSYFTSYFVTFGLHMLRGMLLRADRRRMYS